MRPLPVLLAFALAASGLAVLAAGSGGADSGASGQPVAVRSDRPLDPRGPWVLSAKQVTLAPADGVRVSASTPLAARSEDAPVDRVVILDPAGHPLAGLACQAGACEVRTPLGVHQVPAGTVHLEGAWQQGRVTGASIVGPGEQARVTVDAFGEDGVRVSGDGLAAPVSITSTLVLEGDPTDVDRVALRGPDGAAVLSARPGGAGVASFRVGDEAARVDTVRVQLVGDPLTDDRVKLRLSVDGAWLPGLIVKQTPADAFQRAGEALSEHLVLASPTAPPEAVYRLAAGPVSVEGGGVLSPRFGVDVSVSVPDDAAVDRGVLLVDGDGWARLDLSGVDGDQRVLHGHLTGSALPEGRHELSARLERDIAPGVVQTHTTEPIEVLADATGPSAPAPKARDKALEWAPRDEVQRWEAQARPDGGDWQALPVEGTRAELPKAPAGAWEARSRGIDAAGNPGPWSPVVPFTVHPGGEAPVDRPPRLALEAPAEGARLEGTAAISWAPDAATERVEVSLRADGATFDRVVAAGTSPPIVWETRTVPDGDYELIVTAIGPAGRTTRLVPVTVDNLAPLATSPGVLGQADPPAGDQGVLAMPGHPLPAAVTSGLVLLGLGVAVARWRGTGRAK